MGKAFGLLPTDLKLRQLSRFQLLWLYIRVKRDESLQEKSVTNQTKLICSFINPEAAEKLFKDTEVIESDSDEFERAIMERDPNFDMSTFKKMMGDQ